MMKRIRINTGTVGLVFKRGDYSRILTKGVYWIFPFETVIRYDRGKPFYMPAGVPGGINLLLEDQDLRQELTVVDVQDNEICLQYEDGNFKQVLIPGKHMYWKGSVDHTFIKADLSKVEITEDIGLTILERREVLPYLRVFVVESYEKAVLYIDGMFDKILTTGTYFFWKNTIPVKVDKVDLRQRQIEVSGQEILTRDKAPLRVNFMAQYRVTDIEKAVIDNKDYEKQLYTFMQLALREYIGTLTLDELLDKKDGMAAYVREVIKPKAEALGVTVTDCGVRDIILPGEVRDIMNQVLVAQKQAQANVIMRREETASTRSLLNTAKLMEDNEMLFKLKEMEYVEKIAEKIGEITVTGNGQVIDQLKSIFTNGK